MKTKNLSVLVGVTLLGVSKFALADESMGFTPVESLPPEQRAIVFEQINNLPESINLNWEDIAAGVNDSGETVLIEKSSAKLINMSSASCFGGTSKKLQ